MLTTQKLKEFSKTVDELKLELNELLHQRTQKHLFDNLNDFEHSKIAVSFCPQDYYNIRFFDLNASLNLNRHTKRFYLFIETTRFDFYRCVSFTDLLCKYNIEIAKLSDKNFILSENTDFEKAVKIFYELCNIIVAFYIGENKLFVYL